MEEISTSEQASTSQGYCSRIVYGLFRRPVSGAHPLEPIPQARTIPAARALTPLPRHVQPPPFVSGVSAAPVSYGLSDNQCGRQQTLPHSEGRFQAGTVRPACCLADCLCLTRKRSQVQSLYRPPRKSEASSENFGAGLLNFSADFHKSEPLAPFGVGPNQILNDCAGSPVRSVIDNRTPDDDRRSDG